MNIGQAAKASGLSSKTIRYYEDIELIRSPARAANGYRDYQQRDIEELRFVHHAREVGFSVAECRQLLQLYNNTGRHSAHVKELVLEKCTQIETRMRELDRMHTLLQGLAQQCSGDEGPDCAILDELAGDHDHE